MSVCRVAYAAGGGARVPAAAANVSGLRIAVLCEHESLREQKPDRMKVRMSGLAKAKRRTTHDVRKPLHVPTEALGRCTDPHGFELRGAQLPGTQ